MAGAGNIAKTLTNFLFAMSLSQWVFTVLIGIVMGIAIWYLMVWRLCKRLDDFSAEPTDQVVRSIKNQSLYAGIIGCPLCIFILLLVFTNFNIRF